MNQNQLKKAVAKAAVLYSLDNIEKHSVIGVGTGSTANFFIDELAEHKDRFYGTVASSEATEQKLKEYGIPVFDLNGISDVRLYVDGADEINSRLQLIKGGGGALTREKIVAAVAQEFICIADKSKWVDDLGAFPLPVEVIPMSRSHVARELINLGGDPVWRHDLTTDNGNFIIDVGGLYPLAEPEPIETKINQITGVVTNGLFAHRSADVVMLASDFGIEKYSR